jgi:hypothetical protein
MIDDTTVLTLSSKVSFQPLGPDEGAVVLRTDSGQLYTCNDTALALIQAVDGQRSLGAITDLMLDEFDVARDLLATDLIRLADELQAEGIVEILAPGR